ncbi:polyprenyl synthetase family protein [Nocardiopsis sp. CC223A]|uniref:polyprenyl synthetase family protein n=1 Tax=Nocardiopsis sp. CC223A TaxID=3044051 RepID=UPI00278C2738|nr:polyprenyl synthetase family protein [Nocardiopsis sp. CC223A]
MTTPAVDDLRDLRTRLLDRVESRLDTLLRAERERWARIDPRACVPVDDVASLVTAGGKRLRPAFLLSGHLAAGGDPEDTRAVDCAAAVELVHVGALLHDDVLDDSDLRRGRVTAHVRHLRDHIDHRWRGEARRYGEGVAVLSGDFADILADRLTAELPPGVRLIWNAFLTEIVIGQHLDVDVAARSVVDPDLSRWIAVCKSGRYSIHRPLLLGAALAGRHDLAPVFERYGESLGEAFQLRDDLIDLFGDSDHTGKPVGHDLETHKMTLLLALAVRRDAHVRALVEQPEWDVPRLRDRLDSLGIGDVIEERIGELVADAVQALEHSSLDSAWRDELVAMAHEVAYRNR